MKKVMLSAMVCAMVFSSEVYAKGSHPFDGVYFGAGVGGNFFKISDEVTPRSNGIDVRDGNYSASRFMGSIVLGGGKVIDKVYGGVEALFDVMKNKKIEMYTTNPTSGDRQVAGDIQMKGFVPQGNIKVGYSIYDNIIAYGKFGCAWSKVQKTRNGRTTSKSKHSFVAGLGTEMALNNSFSAGLEAEYNFGFKTDGATYNKGVSVRALIKYNIR